MENDSVFVYIENEIIMNKNIESGYLDVVFAHRNKAYGAYTLRSNYNKRMLWSSIIISTLVLVFFAWNQYAKNVDEITNDNSTLHDNTEIILGTLYMPEKENLEIVETKAELGRTAKTEHITVPVIVEDNKTTQPLLKKVSDDALAGPVDNIGLENGNAIALDNSLHTGNGNPEVVVSKTGDSTIGEPTQPSTLDNEPLKFASEMPSFPGGMEAWQQFLNKNLKYPNVARENGTQGKVLLNFVVNNDGSLVDINVVRKVGDGCSEEAVRVLKSSPKWISGKHNGYSVRVKMTLPVTFALQ